MNAVVHEAINRQINAELTASYSYLQMSAFCARQAFNGCAHWLRLQSQEEYGHAMKLYDFLIARDGDGGARGDAGAEAVVRRPSPRSSRRRCRRSRK